MDGGKDTRIKIQKAEDEEPKSRFREMWLLGGRNMLDMGMGLRSKSYQIHQPSLWGGLPPRRSSLFLVDFDLGERKEKKRGARL